jgi:hypothetical protein
VGKTDFRLIAYHMLLGELHFRITAVKPSPDNNELSELDNVMMANTSRKNTLVTSKPNPFHPSENPTNSEGQLIIFGDSRFSPCSVRFRPNIHPTFLPTTRYSVVQNNSH